MRPIDHQELIDSLAKINESIQTRKYPPTHREIAAFRGHTSPASGHRIVHKLIEAGLVTIQPGAMRSMRITHSGMKALTETL